MQRNGAMHDEGGSMDTQQIESFRRRLQEQKAEVEADIAQLEQETAEYDETSTDFVVTNHIADKASDIFLRERNIALIMNLRNTLSLIEHACDELQAGRYGTCERCHNAISMERLEFLPYATQCIDCQSLREQARGA
jgi:RNA polymerase-binding protein DksA